MSIRICLTVTRAVAVPRGRSALWPRRPGGVRTLIKPPREPTARRPVEALALWGSGGLVWLLGPFVLGDDAVLNPVEYAPEVIVV